MRNDSERILFYIPEPTEVELAICINGERRRPPTAKDLKQAGLCLRGDLQDRARSLLLRLGEDMEEGPLGALRYFIEYLTLWDHEPPEELIAEMRALIGGGSDG